MSIYASLFVCLLGLLVYGFASNPKAAEAGRIAYFVGLLVFLWLVIGARLLPVLR